MGVMQLHTIEASIGGASRCPRKQRRQRARQLFDMWQFKIGHSLAIPLLERFAFMGR